MKAAVDGILAEFRAWLERLDQAGREPMPTKGPDEPIDLFTLLGQMTALRHEVNLLT
ncbi:MAG: hypothetical protein RMJ52_03295 [Gemmataceae bacterium]|nr:hypothetical protein [Gemmataceae bacterium]